jgi:hypothetical protein
MKKKCQTHTNKITPNAKLQTTLNQRSELNH